MCPPRPHRGRSSVLPHTVVFNYTLEYEILEETPLIGCYKFQYPPFFPSKIHPPKLPISGRKETKTFSLPLVMEDALIESMLREPFTHHIYIPYDPEPPPQPTNPKARRSIRRNVDTYLPEYLQLDTKPLMMPDKTEVSMTCCPKGYSFFKFTIHIDKPILNQQFMAKFTPVFIYLKAIESMPFLPYSYKELEDNFAPVFFKCKYNSTEYTIRPQHHTSKLVIDTYICVIPREQTEFYIEVHDRDPTLPSMEQSIGTGVVAPYSKLKEVPDELYLDTECLIQEHVQNKISIGYCKFKVLPSRKIRLGVCPSKNVCVISPGNFFECQTELIAEILDPTENMVFENPDPPPPPSQQMKNVLNIKIRSRHPSNAKLPSKKPQIVCPEKLEEDHSSMYHRWIFTCSIEDNMTSEMIFDAIQNYHSLVFEEQNREELSKYSYSKALEKSVDFFTGFIMYTPDEKIFIVEAHADKTNHAGTYFDKILNNLPKSVHLVRDSNIKFHYPRIYSNFEHIIQEFHIPIPVANMPRIQGLYFHNSLNSVLFTIVQKLQSIMKCDSIKLADECDFFPTISEIVQLQTKCDAVIDADKNICIIDRECANKHKNSRFFLPMDDPFLSTSSIAHSKLFEGFVPEPVIEQKVPRVKKERRPITYVDDSHAKEIRAMHKNKEKVIRKPPYVPVGTKKRDLIRNPLNRIGCMDNGNVEIWAVDDPNELIEDGWEIQIVKAPDDPIYRSPSAKKNLHSNSSTNTKANKALSAIRQAYSSIGLKEKQRTSLRRPQTDFRNPL